MSHLRTFAPSLDIHSVSTHSPNHSFSQLVRTFAQLFNSHRRTVAQTLKPHLLTFSLSHLRSNSAFAPSLHSRLRAFAQLSGSLLRLQSLSTIAFDTHSLISGFLHNPSILQCCQSSRLILQCSTWKVEQLRITEPLPIDISNTQRHTLMHWRLESLERWIGS